MLMQNFGGTNKKYYGIFESGLLDNSVGFDSTHQVESDLSSG